MAIDFALGPRFRGDERKDYSRRVSSQRLR